MILLIDNYDSFVHNLARYLQRLGERTLVVRNDATTVAEVERLQPDAIVISPGPCTPAEAGCSVEIVRSLAASVPILGVCLGHQAIAAAFGASIVRAAEPRHGRTSLVEHSASGLFQHIPSPLTVCRYHSLIVDEKSLPSELRITAFADDGAIMALEHTTHPVFGVQFHPEAALTQHGYQLLANFLRLAGRLPDVNVSELAASENRSPTAPAYSGPSGRLPSEVSDLMLNHQPEPPQLGQEGRIIEGVITTENADGTVNVSPMGPIVDDAFDRLWLRPFQTSTTYRNLKRTGVGVFHVTDDVELFAQSAVGQPQPIPRMIHQEGVDGAIIATACRWYALAVESIDDADERTSIVAHVVAHGALRDFVGFNRAKHAVIEAAILATRIHLTERSQLLADLQRLAAPVEKTGAAAEVRAFAFLCNYITRELDRQGPPA